MKKIERYRPFIKLLFPFIIFTGCALESTTKVENKAEFSIEKILTVGSAQTNNFKTLPEALEYLDSKKITNDETFTIKLAGEIFEHSSQILLNHPNGENITITGEPLTSPIKSASIVIESGENIATITLESEIPAGITAGMVAWLTDSTPNDSLHGGFIIREISTPSQFKIESNYSDFYNNPAGASPSPPSNMSKSKGSVQFMKTVLKFKNCNGLVLSQGNRIKDIDKLALVGNGTIGTVGLFLTENSSMNRYKNHKVSISYFHLGIYAMSNSSLYANGFSLNNNTGDGINANYGSSIIANNAITNNNGRSGMVAIQRSLITANYSRTMNNGLFGVSGAKGSTIIAYNIQVKYNSLYGILLEQQSNMQTNEAKILYNKTIGGYLIHNSTLNIGKSDVSFNGEHGIFLHYNSCFYAIKSTFSNNKQRAIKANALSSVDAQLIFLINNNNTPDTSDDYLGSENCHMCVSETN